MDFVLLDSRSFYVADMSSFFLSSEPSQSYNKLGSCGETFAPKLSFTYFCAGPTLVDLLGTLCQTKDTGTACDQHDFN